MKRTTLFLIVVGIVAYNWWVRHGLAQPSVVLIPAAPLQRDIGTGEPFFYKRYTITPLASFSMEGMVLGRETYKSGRESELSPVDLVLGWGLLSDLSVLDKLTVVQSNRRGYLSSTSKEKGDRFIFHTKPGSDHSFRL